MWQADVRNGNVVDAERALAAFAVEVDVLVVVVFVAVGAVAYFIAYPVASVLKDMNQMMLAKQRQDPEYAGLIDRQNFAFQLAKRHGMLGFSKCPTDQYAIGRGLYSVRLEQSLAQRSFVFHACKDTKKNEE